MLNIFNKTRLSPPESLLRLETDIRYIRNIFHHDKYRYLLFEEVLQCALSRIKTKRRDDPTRRIPSHWKIRGVKAPAGEKRISVGFLDEYL